MGEVHYEVHMTRVLLTAKISRKKKKAIEKIIILNKRSEFLLFFTYLAISNPFMTCSRPVKMAAIKQTTTCKVVLSVIHKRNACRHTVEIPLSKEGFCLSDKQLKLTFP